MFITCSVLFSAVMLCLYAAGQIRWLVQNLAGARRARSVARRRQIMLRIGDAPTADGAQARRDGHQRHAEAVMRYRDAQNQKRHVRAVTAFRCEVERMSMSAVDGGHAA